MRNEFGDLDSKSELLFIESALCTWRVHMNGMVYIIDHKIC